MRFETGAACLQLGEHIRHQRFEGREQIAIRVARSLGQGLGRAHAGDDVLALRVDQELAVKLVVAGRGIAGEDDTGSTPLAHIAEHHGLQGHGGAPVVGNVVQAAIGDGARVRPGAEHRGDRAPELHMQILREGLAALLLDQYSEALDDLQPIFGRQLGVELEAS